MDVYSSEKNGYPFFFFFPIELCDSIIIFFHIYSLLLFDVFIIHYEGNCSLLLFVEVTQLA